MMWHHYGMQGFMFDGALLTLLLLLGAAAAVLWALRRPGPPAHRDDAGAILAERYARGEIDDEEFQRRKSRLRMP
ncbi:SHOCT domain-containing protein [Dactylosporangium sp. CA-139066]|uniref:SHOCT domain-containing protein n=1 Tax=Dactylosporangium sp. CA-139066 TaxID=3239930 RepID=UPI003D8ED2F0